MRRCSSKRPPAGCNSTCKVAPTTYQLWGTLPFDWRHDEKHLRPIPAAYLKLVKGNFNVEVGALPTLIGAEYTFSFENMNIERGLLWNQENAVNRGIQLNDTYKKLTVAFSWNDGFYSNRYTWLSGSLAYAFNASNTLSFVGGGNAGAYAKNTLATPLYLK